jgi:hypothetical protein
MIHVNIITQKVTTQRMMTSEAMTMKVPRTPRCQPRKFIQLCASRKYGALTGEWLATALWCMN